MGTARGWKISVRLATPLSTTAHGAHHRSLPVKFFYHGKRPMRRILFSPKPLRSPWARIKELFAYVAAART
jgi:hypothetical protein